MDSSYHVRTNLNVRRGINWALVYIVYIRERYSFSLVYASNKAVLLFIQNKGSCTKGGPTLQRIN